MYLTYGDLFERIEDSTTDKKLILEYKNLLFDFSRFFEKSLRSKIDEELEIPSRANEFLEYAKGKSSHMHFEFVKRTIEKFREVYVAIAIDAELNTNTFSQTLRLLMGREVKKESINIVSKKLGIPTCILARWVAGTYLPARKNLPKVALLEKYYGLPDGALRKQLGTLIFGEKLIRQDTRVRTQYSQDIKRLQELPFSLPFRKWPTELQKEAQLVKDFYTLSIQDLEAKQYWKHKTQSWGDPNGTCNTYRSFKRKCERFFGFLTASPRHKNPLQRGLGIQKKYLSIALLVNADLIARFINFLNVRHNGKDTTGSESCLKSCMALLQTPGETNPRLGLFRQLPELSKKYFTIDQQNKIIFPLANCVSDPEKAWLTLCETNLSKMRRLMGSRKFVPFRKIKEPIQGILDQQAIYNEMKTILHKMKFDAELTGIRNCEKAKRYRNYVLSLLLFLFELRSHHYSSIKIGKHIVKVGNKYHFKIFKDELKNPEVLDDDEVSLELPADVSRCIEIYLKEYRPQLYVNNSDYFFVPCKASNNKRRKEMAVTPKALSREFSRNMCIYSSSKSGFGAHAVRRLVGTALDRKRDLPDFVIPATLALHSKEVERDHYSSDQVRSAFNHHLELLQKEGVLEMTGDEVRLIKVDEVIYNRMLLENDRLKKENAAYNGKYPYPLLAKKILGSQL